MQKESLAASEEKIYRTLLLLFLVWKTLGRGRYTISDQWPTNSMSNSHG
jgi:hypothetical protein